MTAYQFSQPWLSKMDGDQQSNALEWAHLRDYLKGVDNGTIPLFNPNFLNFTINGTSFTLPVSIANGGTNSTTALANGLLMVSAGGKIVEIAADSSAGSHKITSLSNGTASSDAATFGQIKVIQTILGTTTSDFSTTSSTFQTSNLSATITPTSASNRVLIIVSSLWSAPSSGAGLATIFRGSTNLAAAAGNADYSQITLTSNITPLSMSDIDSPATTSATTYAVKIANTNNVNSMTMGNSSRSTIILMEIV